MRTKILIAVVALFATTFGMAVAAGAAKPKPPKPDKQYLALGDSLAFGFQERILDHEIDTGDFDEADYNHGYVDYFAKKLHTKQRDLAVTNYACPGETTVSYFKGCETWPGPFHDDYAGAQSKAAVAFLKANPDVGTITINLGANDLLEFTDGQCGGDPDCITKGLPKELRTIKNNMAKAVHQLRQAAPDAVIIAMQYYNPFAVDDPSGNDLILAVNDAIAQGVSKYNVKLADAFPPFNLAKREPQTLCRLTLFCSDGDIHASNAGYQVIGNLMWAVSGYK